MTKNEKIQQDIEFAQNRLNAKLDSLKKLENSDLPENMKQAYRDGIKHEYSLIEKFQKKLEK
jgi:hypothetical protein